MIRVSSPAPGVRELTFDRAPANALDAAMYRRLGEVCRELAADTECRALVLSSAVEGIFMAGADLKEFGDRDRSPEGLAAHLDRIHAAFNEVAGLPMPVVAAIDGHAMGGGCELALCADFRIMTRGRARIGLPEVTLGLMPGGGGTQRLARLVGRLAASRMALLGGRLDADAAAAIGLVEAVDGPARDRALELASELAAQAPEAVRRIKRALVEGLAGTLEGGLALERRLAAEQSGSAEALEGVTAFLERRPPPWRR